jgi:hypothetical protein
VITEPDDFMKKTQPASKRFKAVNTQHCRDLVVKYIPIREPLKRTCEDKFIIKYRKFLLALMLGSFLDLLLI